MRLMRFKKFKRLTIDQSIALTSEVSYGETEEFKVTITSNIGGVTFEVAERFGEVWASIGSLHFRGDPDLIKLQSFLDLMQAGDVAGALKKIRALRD